MPMLTVKVTRTKIKRGRRGSCCDCPVALALKTAGAKYPRVMEFYVELYNTERSKSADLPKRCKDFITAFDRGDQVKPFSFRLWIPKAFVN